MAKRIVTLARRVGANGAAARIGATLPGLGGMALLALGAAWIYPPAGLLVGGLLLLRIDSRL